MFAGSFGGGGDVSRVASRINGSILELLAANDVNNCATVDAEPHADGPVLLPRGPHSRTLRPRLPGLVSSRAPAAQFTRGHIGGKSRALGLRAGASTSDVCSFAHLNLAFCLKHGTPTTAQVATIFTSRSTKTGRCIAPAPQAGTARRRAKARIPTLTRFYSAPRRQLTLSHMTCKFRSF